MFTRFCVFCFILAFSGGVSQTAGQSSAFTYQGRLSVGGGPANGVYDLRFRLAYDAAGTWFANGGSAVAVSALPVTNGLFSVFLDFGNSPFTGTNLWVEIAVRTNGGQAFTVLSPLQPITPAPYAIFANTAANLSGTLSATRLTGTLPSSVLSGTYTGAVSFFNPANQFAGGFLGDGAGMTNLNASALTSGAIPLSRLPVATSISPGILTSNQFEMLSVTPYSQQSMLRTPMLGVDIYHGPYGPNWTDAQASNMITLAAAAGLPALGWKYIQFTDGLWGSRSNLHLYPRKPPTQANVHDITNLIKHAKAAGLIPGVYSEPNPVSSCSCGVGSGGWPGPVTNEYGEFPLAGPGAYIEVDAADWLAMGAEYVQYDVPGSPSIDDAVYQDQRLAAALRAAAPSKPVIIRSSGYGTNLPGFNPLKPASVLTSWRGSLDAGNYVAWGIPFGWDGNWQGAVATFEVFAQFNYSVGPGHNYYFDSPVLGAIAQGQQMTNQTKGNHALWAMACSDIMHASFYDSLSPGQYRFLTNQMFLRVHQDPLVIPASLARTDSVQNASVWARPLVDDSKAVMFVNRNAHQSSPVTVSINWTNLGWASNDLVAVYDVLGDANLEGMNSLVATTYGGYSRSVAYESADLFILSRLPNAPQYNFAGGQSIRAAEDGTLQTWPLAQDIDLPAAYLKFSFPPDSGLGNGPANAFYEPAAYFPASESLQGFLWPPRWATNLVLAYGASTDQPVSYSTNDLFELSWSDLRNRVSSPPTSYGPIRGGTNITFFTNSFALSTNWPKYVVLRLNPGTNTLGKKYLLGPLRAVWR